jgi:hypothetical protein
MTVDKDFWDWLWDEDETSAPPPPKPATATATRPRVEAEAPEEPVESVEPMPPVRGKRASRRRSARRPRWIGVVAFLAVVSTAAVAILVIPRGGRPSGEGEGPAVAGLGEQRVVAWTVWDEKRGERPFVAVLAAGGGREPVAIAVPGNAAVNIPGRNLGTIEEAADTGDAAAVAATMENVLGVQVDEAWGIDINWLKGIVEAVGGIQAGFESLDGAGVAAYLRDTPDVERSIRWQEVLTGLLEALDRAPGALEETPSELRPVFTAGADEAIILPVNEVEAGLATPDDEAIAELVEESFVPTGSEERVRLVVLNGNGAPGIGEHVARMLVPEGFKLVANENAESFDQEETQIVATSEGFLDDARRAQRLLGVGKVYIGTQPTYLADVFVIVGKDFMPDDAGGP